MFDLCQIFDISGSAFPLPTKLKKRTCLKSVMNRTKFLTFLSTLIVLKSLSESRKVKVIFRSPGLLKLKLQQRAKQLHLKEENGRN